LEDRDQHILEHREERKGWKVVRRYESKEMLTVFNTEWRESQKLITEGKSKYSYK